MVALNFIIYYNIKMKKNLLLLIISVGLVSAYFSYQLADRNAAIALDAAEQAALLDAELAAYEAELVAKLALQQKEKEMAKKLNIYKRLTPEIKTIEIHVPIKRID